MTPPPGLAPQAPSSGATDLAVGIDIGGTFTDLCVTDETGIVGVGKVLTTHGNPAEAVVNALSTVLHDGGIDPGRITKVIHGTTLVTNALIERKGARTALITTEGFRDVLEMAREHRYELYDLDIDLPSPLVPRSLRFPVTERTLVDGTITASVDPDEILALGRRLEALGVEAVAVCFLHSHVNPANERTVGALLAEHFSFDVALSSDVNPEIREYERFTTTTANVYVQRTVRTYLDELRRGLVGIGVLAPPLIMLSNGGLAGIEVSARYPIRMLESGPAGGALGAAAFGKAHEAPMQMAFDMGGTTAKLCLVEDYRPLVSHEFEVDRVYRMLPGSGLPVRAPVIDLIEIGAGGGSIARVNPLGLITVGPDSAGSEPGPACYGRGGTEPTVTDANLVLGFLSPGSFLGGRMSLDLDAAREAIRTQVAEPLGVSVEEAAWGIHASVNENMANAARVHAVERGSDPDSFSFFVSGGNGPLHGPGVANALGSRTLLAPPAAGVLSALGFLSAPISFDVSKSAHALMSTITRGTVDALVTTLCDEGADLLRESGVAEEDVTYTLTVEMRFVGQGSEIEVVIPTTVTTDHDEDTWRSVVIDAFLAEYHTKFGSVAPQNVDVEILTWRITASGPDPELTLSGQGASGGRNSDLGSRPVYFGNAGGWTTTALVDRYALAPGDSGSGPALVVENESTLLVPPGAVFTTAADGSILLDLTPETAPNSTESEGALVR